MARVIGGGVFGLGVLVALAMVYAFVAAVRGEGGPGRYSGWGAVLTLYVRVG